MILQNLRTMDGRIVSLLLDQSPALKNITLDFEEALIFPGLINSHDHLDFNLFPQVGDTIYPNYVAWGEYIHVKYKEAIQKVLNIPLALRAQWGLYKNLLCGVTTVVNHGAALDFIHPPITVLQEAQSLHSVLLEKSWRTKLNHPSRLNDPCVIHIGEGTDEAASKEIDHLLKWNLFNRDLVGVHGIALDKKRSAQFKAIIWCPVSNYFLYGRTAAIQEFDCPVLFGTDSTLTGSWNIWEHLRFARKKSLITDAALYASVTQKPAAVWELNNYEAEQWPADLVITRKKNEKAIFDEFFSTEPDDILMVIQQGKIRMFDSSLSERLSAQGFNPNNYSTIHFENEQKFVQGNLPDLMDQIKNYYPEVEFPIAQKILS